MRVLFLNPVATLGGAERVLLQCLAELSRVPGFEPQLITLDHGDLIHQAEEMRIPSAALTASSALSSWGDSDARSLHAARRSLQFLGRVAAKAPDIADYIIRLNRLIRAFRPDVIHSNGIKTHLLACFARPALVPVVWHVHDFYSLRPLANGLLRVMRRGVRAAVAISQAVADDVKHCLPGMRTEVIRNTVDCVRFAPGSSEGAELDRLAGLQPLSANGFRIGLVAAFARWKGHEVFLRAAADVVRMRVETPMRFYIVGGPIYHTRAQYSVAELQSLADRLGILGHVAFVPFQANPAFVYRSLDIVVHASQLPEPFGLTIAEAMACGRPVIVSRAGGAIELFEPDQEAVGVLPGNVGALATAIIALCGDEAKRKRLGIAARERAIRDFAPGRLGPQLARFYHRYARRATDSVINIDPRTRSRT